jgi:hypothetical protein
VRGQTGNVTPQTDSIGVAISQKANHDLTDLLRIEWHSPSLIFGDRIIAQVDYNEVLDVSRAQVC